MKKFIVLGALFILPIVAYLFFSSGVNNFAKLPVLTPKVDDLENFKTIEGESLSLENKITILSFYGNDIESKEGNAFNLNEKIYDRNYNFNDFQFVVVAANGTQDQSVRLVEELSTTIDTKKWNFVFGSEEDIEHLFESLQTDLKLDNTYGSIYTFIIDKNRDLRGRPQNDDEQVRYGYDTSSVADLTNTMTDDVKVILAEYRLALKKYNRKEALK
ncbi:hypothetical protein [Mesonia sp.]|uniref:hypothetical protein n=1 Tax=Mesonia sp. TaxID=1960830 RepID=UPI00175224B1|nr:hypothetical protein [Mesonia sp.]HIB36516.1 hypothetical protein [Mesonia sp.]HIO26658.1 hypothetical protein [Flavobacteriaceae bacterium]